MEIPPGIVVSAPASHSGKTTVTIGLIGALRRQGLAVAAAKCGPDYIDTQYLGTACGRAAINLDAWAMPRDVLRWLAASSTDDGCDAIVIEGAMGVLDGAGKLGRGCTADVAVALNLPLVLVVDARGLARSAQLAPAGLKAVMPEVKLAGVILNNVKSNRHLELARSGLDAAGIPLLGWMPSDPRMTVPGRHLGLVTVADNATAEDSVEQIVGQAEQTLDIKSVLHAMGSPQSVADDPREVLQPLGQSIAIARDRAFSFIYQHVVDGWRSAGVSLSFFSPLADEAPCGHADTVYLPGGYPELHADRIAAAQRFRRGMDRARSRNAIIYGECGGYMVLGKGLQDKNGVLYEMLGFLPHSTTFQKRKLRIGYRLLSGLPGSPFKGTYVGHEHHYAGILEGESGQGLFKATDADRNQLGCIGQVNGSVSGSFAHLICRQQTGHSH